MLLVIPQEDETHSLQKGQLERLGCSLQYWCCL